MKTSTSAALAVAVMCHGVLGAITLNFSRNKNGASTRRRHLEPRETIFTDLLNNITAGSYSVEVEVGTPPQKQSLAIDTGSSDVWLLNPRAELCSNPEGFLDIQTGELQNFGCSSTFDSQDSSTFEVILENAFNISYLDGSYALGDYIQDDFTIGGVSIKGQQLGYAQETTVEKGIMGIGYSSNLASNSRHTPGGPFVYDSIIDQMFNQSLISIKAYSLYLDDKSSDSGSIIFGGLDSDKYVGNLIQMPIVPDTYLNGTNVFATLAIAMTGFSIINGTSTQEIPTPDIAVVLDSGTTLTYLPSQITSRLYWEIDAYDDSDFSGLVYADCGLGSNSGLSLNYAFGSGSDIVEITVSISELLYDPSQIFATTDYMSYLQYLPLDNPCVFGIFPDQGGPSILGDTFLRSAYVVYDLTNNLIALAQTNFNSTTSSVVEFTADATEIPNVSGVASSANVVQTNTGILGGGGGIRTGDPTKTRSGSATSVAETTQSSSGNAGVKAVSAFNAVGLMVLGVSGAFSILGAGVFFL